MVKVDSFYIGSSIQNPTGFQMLAHAELAAPATSIDSGSLGGGTNRMNLLIFYHCAGKSGADELVLTFNGDTGNNYAWRAGANSNSSQAKIQIESSAGSDANKSYGTIFVNNYGVPGLDTVAITASKSAINVSNATVAPTEVSCVGVWVNAAQKITSVQIKTSGGVQTMNANSWIAVYGASMASAI